MGSYFIHESSLADEGCEIGVRGRPDADVGRKERIADEAQQPRQEYAAGE